MPVRKRVAAQKPALSWRRWAVYRLRQEIGTWSHRVFLAARSLRWPGLYTGWARTSLALYQAFAWSRGRLGRLLDRLESLGARGRPEPSAGS
jgi:hypothetical protein